MGGLADAVMLQLSISLANALSGLKLFIHFFKKFQLGINKIQRKGTECLSLVRWGNTLLKYSVVLETELVTVSVVLHTP